MKAREERYKILMPARIRWRGAWEPASVRNISSRGMMLRAGAAPPPGTYVEIELANRVVAARAIWCDGQSCGFRTQDVLDVTSLRGARGGGQAATPAASTFKAPSRPKPTPQEITERSRQMSAMFQFSTLVVVGLGTAIFVASEVYRVLSAPINAISDQLH